MMRYTVSGHDDDQPTDSASGDLAAYSDGGASPLSSLLPSLLRDGFVRLAVPPARRTQDPGETPIEGEGAVARWLALHDRARDLRAALALCPGDGVGTRQAQRAIRSLFLYEHQLTPKTRRRARTLLWLRERSDEALPGFAERTRWTRCRCAHCEPLRPSFSSVSPALTAPLPLPPTQPVSVKAVKRGTANPMNARPRSA
jgi:hypothetical protein